MKDRKPRNTFCTFHHFTPRILFTVTLAQKKRSSTNAYVYVTTYLIKIVEVDRDTL